MTAHQAPAKTTGFLSVALPGSSSSSEWGHREVGATETKAPQLVGQGLGSGAGVRD